MSSPVEVSLVSSRKDRAAFIKFPWQIYKDDPAWVPPLIIERKAFLDRKKHPFYLHGDAALFLARRGDEIVGRIMASDDPNYNASINQTSVASACSNQLTISKLHARFFARRAIGFLAKVATKSWAQSITRRITSAVC